MRKHPAPAAPVLPPVPPPPPIPVFSDPTFIGKSFVLEDTLMYIKRESYHLEFFTYDPMTETVAPVYRIQRQWQTLKGWTRNLVPRRIRSWSRT